MNNPDAPITGKASAAYVGMAYSQFIATVRAGRGPAATQIGQCKRWRRSSLDAWLDKNTEKQGAGGLDCGACGLDAGFALSDHGSQT